MSVRFQFAGDKDISVGRAGGASLFKLPGAISFPAAGTILQTLTGQTYPIAEGGASVYVNITNYPSETASVYRKADGSGGDYLDWASAFDIAYIGNGTTFASSPNQTVSVEVPSGSLNYYQGGTYIIEYKHDGAGGYYEDNTTYSYYMANSDTNISGLDSSNQCEVPSGSNSFYNNGTFTGYTWNGSGGYNYPVAKGGYYSAGTAITSISLYTEVPSGSGQTFNNGLSDTYVWDGSGGYTNSTTGSYHAYGTYITNYSGTDYYWDAAGGYYS